MAADPSCRFALMDAFHSASIPISCLPLAVKSACISIFRFEGFQCVNKVNGLIILAVTSVVRITPVCPFVRIFEKFVPSVAEAISLYSTIQISGACLADSRSLSDSLDHYL